MSATRIITTTMAVLLLCTAARAAKKSTAAPQPSKSQVAAETTAKSQRQSIVGEALEQRDLPAAQRSPLESEAGPEQKLEKPQPTPSGISDAAAYAIPWQSVNGGGRPMTSANYRVDSSVGQSSIGYSTSASYQAGVGYWYGISAAGGCSCPHQCDYDEDNFLTALDLGTLIDVLFAGTPEVTDSGCPTSRGDFDCDGFPTALDLGGLIDHLFAGGVTPCDPCSL